MSAAEILGLIALVMGLAVAAEMAGDRVGVPNFLFFILAGLAVGPLGLGLVHHEVFGEQLAVLVGLSVAIIIFHSGSGITREAVDRAPRAIRFMATVGVLVTFLGTAAVAYLVMRIPSSVALLIGALLVATGTTVIEPLMAAVPVDESLASALEIEATVTEVSAGILAVTVFYAFTVGEPESDQFVLMFGWVLLVGVVVGAVIGAVAWILFRKPAHAPDRAPKHASQLYLTTAVVTYAVAENVAEEAGVVAVAVAGVILGNADLPYQEEITEFKESFTTFLIAFIFVVLASFAEPEWLATVGIEGVIVAVLVIVVVRPLAVFLSTAASDLTTREKLFLSAASPRGIIPAGLATLLAIGIQDSNPDTAAYITGTVLLVILLSSTVEGLFAGRVAERFGLTVDRTLVVGGGRLGVALADQYVDRGEQVALVESEWDELERARSEGLTVYHGDGTDPDDVQRAGGERATRIVAATDDDETNAEVARLAQSSFDVDDVLVRMNHEDSAALYDDLDVELLTGSQVELWALEHLLDQSAPDWLDALVHGGGVESVVPSDAPAATVAELDRRLPERAFVVALCRDGETWIPGDEPIEGGDRLTIIGQSAAVERAVDLLTSPAEGGTADSLAPGDAQGGE